MKMFDKTNYIKGATPMTVVAPLVCFRGSGFTFARYLNIFLYTSLMEALIRAMDA